MRVLITGAAGFIGYAVSKQLLERGDMVIGVDNLNNYYDKNLKISRLNILKNFKNFEFTELDILDSNLLNNIFDQLKPKNVIHLAAQPGVRYSILNPKIVTQININGFLNVIECSKNHNINHFIYASSSSVYGKNSKLPYAEEDRVDNPISLYAATKKSNELFAHTYSHLFNLRTTGIRFFTVYGPFGRPDMAAISFINKIINNEKIDIYNKGDMKRDFTYIDDIADGTIKILDKKTNQKNFDIFNLGNSRSINLIDFIKTIEKHLGKKAVLNYLPLQSGDVKNTHSDISKARNLLNYSPKIDIEEGIEKLVEWYKSYNKTNE